MSTAQSTKVTLTCETCGKTFLVFPSAAKNKRFCSIPCRTGDNGKVALACTVCDKPFFAYPSSLKKGGGKFCSPACYQRRNGDKFTCVCASCGKTFLVYPSVIKFGAAKFCSPDCYHQFQAIPFIDRFFRYVGRKTPGGCIPWIGLKNKDGYGLIGSGGKQRRNVLTNRASYELFIGPIPDGLCVLHRCDNPPCLAPAHLFLGDNADNMADKVAKGRQPRGEDIPWARLTESKVRELRSRYATGAETIEGLALEYGFSYSAVRCAIRHLTWKHV